MKKTISIGALVLLTACASKPEKIAALYVPQSQYSNYDCSQIANEQASVDRALIETTALQQKAHDNDTAKTTVGLILFTPILLFNEGNGPTANQLASLKGQKEALRQSAIEKNCQADLTQ